MARSIKWDDKELANKINNIDRNAKRFIAATLKMHSRRAQAYAKRGAPWQDRTGNARGGLSAHYEDGGDVQRIVVAHTVSYGIWLEVRWSGRYAIIVPTVANEGPEVMKTVSTMFAAIT